MIFQNKFVRLFFAISFVFMSSRFFIYPAIDDIITYDEVLSNIEDNFIEFNDDLQQVLNITTKELLILVDKKHFLQTGYVPENLVFLTNKRTYFINRNDLALTTQAEQALEEMAIASKKDGVNLLVSSTYRSYEYQKKLFARYAREYGEKQAETFSARESTSQHQLGTVVDFGSITDEFAVTKQGRWLNKNAWKYGWSLSFPKGYDKVTGYKWECWHFRFIGKPACRLQKKWFGNIQQYMLEYIDSYTK